jgi:glutamate dehydrogenase
MQSSQESGADAAAVARAYTIARDSAELRTLWAQIEALDGRIKTDDQYDALLDTSRYLTHYTLWLLEHRREYAEVGASVTRLQPAIREFAHITPAALEGLDRERYLARSRRYIAQGLPTKLAESLAALEPLRVTPDLVQLAARTRAKARAVARVHFGLSARLGLDWLHGAIEQLPASGDWQRAAQTRLQAAALAAHLKISAGVLPHATRQRRAEAPIAEPALERWQQMLRDVRSLATPDFAALTVAVEALETLATGRHKTLARLL